MIAPVFMSYLFVGVQSADPALLPPVLVHGEPLPSNKLSDRMAKLHVPGVSVAVIHAGKLEWARGYGVTRKGGPPVTPETLFQAASISIPVTTLAVLRLVFFGLFFFVFVFFFF